MKASSSLIPLVAPMEARLADDIPVGDAWQYEPKWDGFRCLAYIRQGDARLFSKSGKRLDRYFPEIADILARSVTSTYVFDGELTVRIEDRLSFGALQARLHPATSRIERLSNETPARYAVFDCLQDGASNLLDAPLRQRRAGLADLVSKFDHSSVFLSEATLDVERARRWLEESDGDTDGVIAKDLDAPYQPGERIMVKVKRQRSADCVVGGFRYAANERIVGSLLLGLYDDAGKLNHVGYTSALSVAERRALTPRLEKLIAKPGFTGRSPGGPSRWSTDRSSDWQPLKPELVVEVQFDHVTDERFRHGTRFLRWRPDKAPSQCRMEQLAM
jgi:ATP-dependent DNA ligase